MKKDNFYRENQLNHWIVSIVVIIVPILLLFTIGTPTFDKLVPLILGIVLILMSLRRLFKSSLQDRWKMTDGTLLYRKVAIDNPQARKMVWSYYPYIRYSYKVNTRVFSSDHVAYYRELRSKPEDIEKLIDDLTASLKVYYNPQNPKESVLIANLPLRRKIFWYFFLLIGLFSFYIGIHP